MKNPKPEENWDVANDCCGMINHRERYKTPNPPKVITLITTNRDLINQTLTPKEAAMPPHTPANTRSVKLLVIAILLQQNAQQHEPVQIRLHRHRAVDIRAPV